VPIIGGATYVKTGILKWWIGGVLMGGVYMVCGAFFYPPKTYDISEGSKSSSNKGPRLRDHNWSIPKIIQCNV
jgi:hypothetical protein